MEKFKKGEFEKLKDSSIDTWHILINSKFTKEEILIILESYQIELPSQNILSNLIKENNILFRKKVEDTPIYYLTDDLRVTYTSFRIKDIHREKNVYKIIFKKKEVKKTVNCLEEEKKEISKSSSVVKEAQIICEYCGCSLNASNRIRHLKKCPKKKDYFKKQKKNKLPCSYEGCNRSFELYTALQQHISDVHKRKESNQNSTVKASSSKNTTL